MLLSRAAEIFTFTGHSLSYRRFPVYWRNDLKRMVIPAFVVAGLLASAPAALSDDDICNGCHDDPEMVRVKAGIPQSLYANSEMIENATIGKLSKWLKKNATNF